MDSLRLFDSEREHASLLLFDSVPDNKRSTIRDLKKQPLMLEKN